MCSPYLTGSLGIMLCLVTFNYWSVSTQNSDLVKKVQEMQQQLHLGTKHIESLEEETREIRKQIKTHKDRVTEERELKNEVEMKFKDVVKNRDDLKERLDAMMVLKSEGDETERKLSEEKENQSKAMDSLRDELEAVKGELLTVKANLTSCNNELTSERSEKILRTPEVAGGGVPPRHLGRSDGLGPGQLPDINPAAVSVIKKETQGSGLTILDGNGKAQDVDKLVDKAMAVSPSPKVEVMNLSSSKKPVSSSSVGHVSDKSGGNESKIVINEAGVMPLPDVVKSGDNKAAFENLDKAEDDSQIVEHENGPEGKKEIQDDDQNPDGQIDETVDLDKQHYLVDKAQEEFGDAGEGAGIIKRKVEGNSFENENGDSVVDDNLESLKESLNKTEQ